MKAFLSHSSKDKEFIRAIANELGRQFCLFDEQVFSTGDELKVFIEKALDDSSIFVLFVSKNALDSVWVQYEIDEAWLRKLYQIISKSLVYLIDTQVTHKDLPEWLKKAVVRRGNVPKIIARDIRNHLNEILLERQKKFFIDRNEIELLENSLLPLDGSRPPKIIFVTGLPGIGRRTLIKHTSPNLLSLRKIAQIRIGEGDNINDICISVADLTEPYSTRNGFERIISQIKGLNEEASLQRIINNLRRFIEAGDLPLFIDDGGLLDSDGFIREPIMRIIKKIETENEIYLFFISTRKPQEVYDNDIPVVRVNSLKPNQTKKLLFLLAEHAKLKVSSSQVNELAEYIAGYPPSSYYAIGQAKDYGIEAVFKDKSRLVKFQTTVFLRHFSRLNIDEKGQQILRNLAICSPLPLSVLAKVTSLDLEGITKAIIHLIDLSLVNVTEDGYYRIADPISNAAISAYGFLSSDQHKILSEAVLDYIENTKSESPLLELHRVLFRSASWANNKEITAKAIYLSNDLIKLTEANYHARKYSNTIKFGYSALEQRKDSFTARNYLIRALIQEERYKDAEHQIKEFEKFAPMREIFFLKGFLERKKGNFPTAISAYERASNLGRIGVATSRELAFCYFKTGELDKALSHIEEALKIHGDNPFLVDLWAQIACCQRDEIIAQKALGRLEAIGDPLFYYHRLSRIELSFGNIYAAQKAAYTAFDLSDSPPFKVAANLIYCETELKNLEQAEILLDQLDIEYQNKKQDIRLGLRCRIEIAGNQFGKALSESERISDKNTPFYKRIRRDALYGELQFAALDDKVRDEYEKELFDLDKDLSQIEMDQYIPSDFG